MCRVLRFSESGRNEWCRRGTPARAQFDEVLLPQLQRYRARSDGTCGAPRVLPNLRAVGERIGQKRVARPMQKAQLVGVSKVKGPPQPERLTLGCPPAPNLVQRRFVATAPNGLCVTDVTYIPTNRGIFYLPIVLDVFNRRIVGWATDVTHRSEQGSQYRAIVLGQYREKLGVRPSLGQANRQVFRYMQGWYNLHQCDSAPGHF